MMPRAAQSLVQRLLALPVAACVLALALAATHAAAQDVEEPAGELPEEDGSAGGDAGLDAADAGTSAPEGSLPDAEGAGDAGPGGEGDGKEKKKDGKGEETERPADTWESYEGKGVAEEITGGVRVEDIVEPPTEYRYAAFGKPDPFVPPMITEQDPAKAAPPGNLEIPIVSPLQKFRLDELKLVGVWQLSSGERKGLILTPAGDAGIIVKNGDPIGNQGGKILAIGDEFLTVREFSLSKEGAREFEDRQMFMGQRPEEDVAGRIRFEPGKGARVILDRQNDVQGVGLPLPAPAKGAAGAGKAEFDGNEAKEKGAAPLPKPADAPVNAAAAGNQKGGASAEPAAAGNPAGGMQLPPGITATGDVKADGQQIGTGAPTNTPAAIPAGGVPGVGIPAGLPADQMPAPP